MIGLSKVQIFSSKGRTTRKTVQSLIMLAICSYVSFAVLVHTCVCFKQPCQPKPCIEREYFSCIQILELNNTMPFVSTIPTYYMVFLCHSKQILHVLPLNNSKAIISYLCQCFIAHEEVCGVYLSILSFTSDRLSQWTSGFIRLSNNFAKRAGNGVPSPN